MARNRFIPESLAKRCQGEPILVAALNPIKTAAPAAIEHVLDELARDGKGRFGVEDLFQGRIAVGSTIDARVQTIVNEALEHGLALYEKRHPWAKGAIQGSVVVLSNGDAAILAETGGRTALPIFREIMLRVYKDQLVGRAPSFPREIEDGIDQYLATQAAGSGPDPVPGAMRPRAGPGNYRRARMFPFGR
jgi:membrane carboxypeptidase/penicillin-binding protein